MKRILVSLLCLCLCVTAVACGRPDLPDDSIPSDVSAMVADTTTTTTTTATTTENTTTTEESTTLGDTTASTTAPGASVSCGGIPTSGTTRGMLCDGGQTTTKTTTVTTTTTTTTTVPTTTTTAQQQTEELGAYALGQTDYKVDVDSVYDGYTAGMSDYYSRVLPQFLSGDESENRVCSPLNVYLALAMLAETAGGNSRQQVLELLGEADTEALSRRTAALWNSVYSDKEGARCLLANSIWLNAPYAKEYSAQTVERLNQKYYASAFSGVMGTPEYNTLLQGWINDNTGGLLKEQAAKEKFTADGIASLVSTLYFKADWETSFDPKKTSKRYFYTDNDYVECDFMHDSTTKTYYWESDNFIAINRAMNGGYLMWYILPDEDCPVERLLHDEDALDMITGNGGAERIFCDLVTKVPKFDIDYDRKLKDDLMTLGVSDLFGGEADLSGLLGPNIDAFVDNVSHAARVITEEVGVEAAAYTGVTIAKSTSTTTRARPLIYFTADHPFMFAITGPEGTVLFAGIVENPTEK